MPHSLVHLTQFARRRKAQIVATQGLATAGLAAVALAVSHYHFPDEVTAALVVIVAICTIGWFFHMSSLLGESEESARRHERGLRKLVEFDKDVIFMAWDQDGMVCQYAGGGARPSGINPDDRLGMNVLDVFGKYPPVLRETLEKIQSGEAEIAECEFEALNVLSGYLDTWRVRLFRNDFPRAGYAHARRVNEEVRQAKANALLKTERTEANARMMRLANMAQTQFFASYEARSADAEHGKTV